MSKPRDVDPGTCGRFEAVSSPRGDEGLSDALRSAYRGSVSDLPEDLRRLLARLR